MLRSRPASLCIPELLHRIAVSSCDPAAHHAVAIAPFEALCRLAECGRCWVFLHGSNWFGSLAVAIAAAVAEVLRSPQRLQCFSANAAREGTVELPFCNRWPRLARQSGEHCLGCGGPANRQHCMASASVCTLLRSARPARLPLPCKLLRRWYPRQATQVLQGAHRPVLTRSARELTPGRPSAVSCRASQLNVIASDCSCMCDSSHVAELPNSLKEQLDGKAAAAAGKLP